MDRVILDDVLYSLSLRYRVNLSENVVEKFIESDSKEKVEHLRKEIARFIRFAKENFDLIRGEFIVFVRRESSIKDSERANGILEDNSDTNFLFRYLPPNIARLYENRLSVQNIERLGNTNKIRLLNRNVLTNEIMLKIKDCESTYTNRYMYQYINNAIDNDDGTISMEIVMGKHSGKKVMNGGCREQKIVQFSFIIKTLLLILTKRIHAERPWAHIAHFMEKFFVNWIKGMKFRGLNSLLTFHF